MKFIYNYDLEGKFHNLEGKVSGNGKAQVNGSRTEVKEDDLKAPNAKT